MRRGLLLAFILALAASAWTLWPNARAAVTPEKFAPEISGDQWINSNPLSIAGLKGRVVLVEFWNYGCMNCRNVVPYLRAWHERFAQAGLTIVGVRAPDFFGKSLSIR